jgi:hemerythrin-like domain-containing protein
MDPHTLAQQAILEHKILEHLKSALEVSLAWEVEGLDCSRKLSSVRFVMQSLERHLLRMMALEEHDGYMEAVVDASPSHYGEVKKLKLEHDEFRTATHRIVSRLDSLTPQDSEAFEATCDDIRRLTRRLAEHSRKEIDLLQEAFLQQETGLD